MSTHKDSHEKSKAQHSAHVSTGAHDAQHEHVAHDEPSGSHVHETHEHQHEQTSDDASSEAAGSHAHEKGEHSFEQDVEAHNPA